MPPTISPVDFRRLLWLAWTLGRPWLDKRDAGMAFCANIPSGPTSRFLGALPPARTSPSQPTPSSGGGLISSAFIGAARLVEWGTPSNFVCRAWRGYRSKGLTDLTCSPASSAGRQDGKRPLVVNTDTAALLDDVGNVWHERRTVGTPIAGTCRQVGDCAHPSCGGVTAQYGCACLPHDPTWCPPLLPIIQKRMRAIARRIYPGTAGPARRAFARHAAGE